MIKAVIFDLWNTLIEPKEDYHAMKRMKQIFDIPDKKYLEVKRGLMTTRLDTTKDITNYLKNEFGVRDATSEDLKEIEKHIKLDADRVRPFYDAEETLKYLKSKGIKIALISNAASFHKEPLYKFGLAKYFDKVIFSCDVGCWKPEEEIYNLALRELNVSPQRTIMVGDHRNKDYYIPLIMGMKGIHLNRGKQFSDKNPEKGHKHEIKSLTEIISIVQDLRMKELNFKETYPKRYENWCQSYGY